jgi:ferredoxin
MYNISGLGIADGTLIEMEAALLEAKKSGFFIFCMKVLGGGVLYKRAEEALDFILGKSFIDCAAVGMKSVLEVEANVNFFETGRFSDRYYRDYNKISKSLHIDEWCSGCGACADRCSQGALYILDNKAVCNTGKCVLCGYCAAACRDFAVKII